MQMPDRGQDGSGGSSSSSGSAARRNKQDSDEGQEGAGDDVRESVADVVQALTELASLQTPASVWLPSKALTVQLSGKVWGCPSCSRRSAADSQPELVSGSICKCLCEKGARGILLEA